MFGREGNAGRGLFLGQLPFPAVLIQPGSPGQDSGKGCGVSLLSSQGERLMDALQGLLGIA